MDLNIQMDTQKFLNSCADFFSRSFIVVLDRQFPLSCFFFLYKNKNLQRLKFLE